MSIKVMSFIFDRCKLKPAAKLLMLAIADNANDDGYAFPAVDTLAKKICMSRRSTINHLLELEEAGFLRVDRQPGRVNHYNIPLPTNTVRVPDKTLWWQSTRAKNNTSAEIAPVQTVAPVPVQTVAPVPVQTVAPEPSYEPSKESSEKRVRARKASKRDMPLLVTPHWVIAEWLKGCGSLPPQPTQNSLSRMNIEAQQLADTLKLLPGETEAFSAHRLKKDGKNIPWAWLMNDLGDWLRTYRAKVKPFPTDGTTAPVSTFDPSTYDPFTDPDDPLIPDELRRTVLAIRAEGEAKMKAAANE